MSNATERLKLLVYGCEDWVFEFRLFEATRMEEYLMNLLR